MPLLNPPGFNPLEHVPTEITRKVVSELYAAGISMERIADRFDICVNTLKKHYRSELDENLENMIGGMVKNLYQDALSGDKKDRELWLKTRGKLAFAKAAEEKEREDKMISLLEAVVGVAKK